MVGEFLPAVREGRGHIWKMRESNVVVFRPPFLCKVLYFGQ